MAFNPKTAKDLDSNSISKKSSFNIGTAKDVDENKSSNLIGRFYSNMQKNLSAKETRPIGVMGPAGVISSALGMPEENLLPIAGQVVGGRLGLPGAVAGATIGQAAKQLTSPLRGGRPDIMALPKEAAITGLTEGVMRGAGSLMFKQQRAVREVTEGAGKKLKEAYETLSNASDTNPMLSVESKKILDVIKPAFDKIKVPFGAQSSLMKRWIKVLETNPKLTARELIELEQDLGGIAEFAKTSGGERVLKEIPKKALNGLVKESRNLVSGYVDDLAEKAGIQGFKQLNKVVSKNLGIAFGKKASLLRTAVTSGSLGGLVGTATMNPALGFGVSGVGIGLTNPILRNTLFRGIERTGLGRAATLGLSESVRREI